MRTTNFGLFIIVGLILLGLGYGFAQLTIQEQQTGTTISLPNFPLIQEWKSVAIGDVVEITDLSLIISSEGSTLTIPFSEEVEISKSITIGDELIEEVKNLTTQDIKVGDRIISVISIDTEGNLRTDDVSILEIQQEQE
ncbi:MAG: hypothetical protein KJI69_03170 [Patescibacteria group bacterium]|nr:hypothetical protein [Patescibacteria group bacterium]